MNGYEIPDAIQWHEGLLLTPQHFQQLSFRHEALVQYGTSLVAPFFWGVRRFKHHQISLTPGIFKVLELEAVMPDGLVVTHGLPAHPHGSPDDRRDGTLEIDLSKLADQIGERGMLVWLTVGARHNGHDESHRYKTLNGDPVEDEVSSAQARSIPRLKPHLTLHAGNTLPNDCVGFPLARVLHRASSFTLDEKFIPPMLAVPVHATQIDWSAAAAQRLGEMCSQMALRVRKRATYLSDQARKPVPANQFANEADARVRMLGLAGALPAFEAVLQTGCAHPYQVYVTLCSLAGHVATLGTHMLPPAFNPYNHNDLYATFEPVLTFIDSAMDQGVPVGYRSFLFNYNEQGAYELRFDSRWMKKKLAIGIKGERGMSEDDVLRWGESCLIGSQSTIEVLREKRIKGAGRKHNEQVGDIVTPQGVALFSLMADEGFVEPEKLLQIVNFEGRGRRPSEIVLYVIDN